jgi:Chemotaxis phosphatase CheX
MSTLPDPKILAALISNVTRTMCGTTFTSGDPLTRGESLCGQMVLIPLTGKRSFTVVVSSDTRGSRALGAAFFGCAESELTQPMIDDAIAELLNMVAAQISNALGSTHTLGLPARTTLPEIAADGGLRLDDAALLHSEGKIDLGLWILERPAAAPTAGAAPAPGGFRSMLRKFAGR